MRPIIRLLLLAGVAAASVQQPLSIPSFQQADTDEYQFDWPIRGVAIIGAGPRCVVCPLHRRITTHPHLAVA